MMVGARGAIVAPIAGGVGLFGLLVLLQWAVSANIVSAWVVPLPSDVVQTLGSMMSEGAPYLAILDTVGAVGATMVAVLILGIPTGYLLYRLPDWGSAFGGFLNSLFAVPMVLLFPVFLMIFGRNYLAIAVCAFLHCVVPVIIYTREGLTSVPQIYLNVGQSFGFSSKEMFWKVMLPWARTTVFTGIRFALIYTLVYVVGIEYLISYGGLGLMIAESHMRFEVVETYASIFLVIIISMSLYFSLRGIEFCLKHMR